jgi:hypothetical protein
MLERTFAAVPVWLRASLVAGLALQMLVHLGSPRLRVAAADLNAPPTLAALRLAGLDERITLAKFTMLYLQAFDNQPGISIPFRELDYARVESWLQRILELDPRGQYPLLCASRLYAEVPVAAKQRAMLDFVYREFMKDPNRRWPWLAHGVIIAKHRLGDLPLALKFASSLREQATSADVPSWARQMEIFVREDMNELQSAKTLLGGLVESGQISDSHERHFLLERLRSLEVRTKTTP